MFEREEAPRNSWAVVVWWEARRVFFNLVVGVYGFACLIVFFIAIASTGILKAGEDAVEPISLCAAPFLINILYTLGWLVEIPLRLVAPGVSPQVGPLLLKAGLGLGLALVSLPAVYWSGYRILQLLGYLK